jgi:hypothetical protein
MRLALRKMVPLFEIKRLKGTVIGAQHRMRVPFKEKRQRTSNRADIHRLPQAIEHQHLLVEEKAHTGNAREGITWRIQVSI